MEGGGSKEVAKAALSMAMSASREEEKNLKDHYKTKEIRAAAVDYGGEAITSMRVIVERAVVAAKRELIIAESHPEEGAIAGATREAMAQILTKALGLNIGGKVGIARKGDHITVAVFFSIGLIHLDEIAVGLGHRAIGQVHHG
ncbi:MAG TPA: HutP family protein [Bacillota bacterium]|nr:HutP family protein [Bacillota bacterium]